MVTLRIILDVNFYGTIGICLCYILGQKVLKNLYNYRIRYIRREGGIVFRENLTVVTGGAADFVYEFDFFFKNTVFCPHPQNWYQVAY